MTLTDITAHQPWAGIDHLQIWRVDLDAHARAVPLSGLSDAEYARAAKMAFDRESRRYLSSRHALRSVLSLALGRSPDSIAIEIETTGKPWLPYGDGLHFNLSHSEHVGVIALSRGQAVGVDVEVKRPIVDADAMAGVHFSTQEQANWARIPAGARDRVFLDVWTRKEACLKALGVGLTVAPSQIDVSHSPDTVSVRISVGDEARCELGVRAVEVSHEVVAAVAWAPLSDLTRAGLSARNIRAG